MGYFFLQDCPGYTFCIARNVKELFLSIQNAPDAVIAHHMRGGGNDFANWVKNTLGKKRLAKKLMKIKLKENVLATKEGILEVLKEEIKG